MRRVFVRFFEESSARKKRFEIIWPLGALKKDVSFSKIGVFSIYPHVAVALYLLLEPPSTYPSEGTSFIDGP